MLVSGRQDSVIKRSGQAVNEVKEARQRKKSDVFFNLHHRGEELMKTE